MSQFNNYPTLDIIMGPMYSGKSTELIRRLSIFSEMGLRVLYINSKIDTRSKDSFSTHSPVIQSLGKIISHKVNNLSEFKNDYGNYDVVGIDEGQFFKDLQESVLEMVEKYNIKVIIAGLNVDSNRKAFGDMISLVQYCDDITKLNPCCLLCSKQNNQLIPAIIPKKIVKNTDQIIVGGKNEYIPVCRKCYLEK